MSALLAQAMNLYLANDLTGALALLTPLLETTDDLDLELLLLMGQCFGKAEQWREAAVAYRRAGDLGPPNAPMLYTLAANFLTRAGDDLGATDAWRLAARSGTFDPDREDMYRRCLHDYLFLEESRAENERLLDGLRKGDERLLGVEFPLATVIWCDDESIAARLTKMSFATPFSKANRAARKARTHAFGEKIRVGYLSGDFFSAHATMALMRGVLEMHDPEAFEVKLFCHTTPKNILMDDGWRDLEPSLVSVMALSDAEAAEVIRAAKIDILVDLKGHTRDSRSGILNAGAAPIQVAYLGFPGSGCGIDYDYIIGDRIVLPESSKPYYHEKFCRLPHSYQANDDFYRPDPPAPPRRNLGLPEDAVVLASFNVARKITHRTATLWARILKGAPQAVLWILPYSELGFDNFVNWMEAQGIARERIFQAGWTPYDAHIGRVKAADLGLDAFPCNGHTTTSDLLWAGVPVATIKGRHFASRVSESLLTAIGLDDLVAEDDDAYVAMMVALASDRSRLKALRARLAENRTTMPLFDTLRLTRHLEAGYRHMVERAKAGAEPDHFDVEAID
ncbi:hypothetical protein BJF93_03485 [Xaviernesmea oryzae]|uniref:O-GlcNAc transferase C-terminal domain-containing protein n=1 Tax=Xaviernesmea oryzae TaxID=464029 RepID=A0A1Q9AZJ6_9HYPH|nr:hypothetical protein [Xaviernesmea oryzae]OLP61122.1 hypothetical protein BJF93_03485 [Xaviernesmea oryzae]SEL12527.1 Glycosyl transferase family 41 [Xaviernesmea oryzae]